MWFNHRSEQKARGLTKIGNRNKIAAQKNVWSFFFSGSHLNSHMNRNREFGVRLTFLEYYLIWWRELRWVLITLTVVLNINIHFFQSNASHRDENKQKTTTKMVLIVYFLLHDQLRYTRKTKQTILNLFTF